MARYTKARAKRVNEELKVALATKMAELEQEEKKDKIPPKSSIEANPKVSATVEENTRSADEDTANDISEHEVPMEGRGFSVTCEDPNCDQCKFGAGHLL